MFLGEKVELDRDYFEGSMVRGLFENVIRSPWLTASSLALLAGAAALSPVLAVPALGIGAFIALRRRESLGNYPLKMPMYPSRNDPNEVDMSTGKPAISKGILFLGNENKSEKEVWLSNEDARQHFLVLGTTGSGKSEALLGFAANALSWGSGFIYCDGKGDVTTFAKVFALCHRYGRVSDLLVLNFLSSNMNCLKTSNTMNPFAKGSADSLCTMVVSLMDDVGENGAMWKGRATAMLTGIMRALCFLRDEGSLELNVGSVRDNMSMRKIMELIDPEKHPTMPEVICKSIRSYLNSLPGFQQDRGFRQAQTTLDQHAYLEMQFTKILGSLADVYGHIFSGDGRDIDMNDIVLNRRILVILLPALEKSGDEIANLGKIVMASLKSMMGSTFTSAFEKNWHDVAEDRPLKSQSPFVCIWDDVGYYTVPGMALMSAQARTLGFSMVYSSQDIPAMKRLNEKEASSIIANTNTKLFMRTEEGGETADLALNAHRRFETNTTKINQLDLKSQASGEMHLLYRGVVVRMKSFYALNGRWLSNRKPSEPGKKPVIIRACQTVSLDWTPLEGNKGETP